MDTVTKPYGQIIDELAHNPVPAKRLFLALSEASNGEPIYCYDALLVHSLFIFAVMGQAQAMGFREAPAEVVERMARFSSEVVVRVYELLAPIAGPPGSGSAEIILRILAEAMVGFIASERQEELAMEAAA